VSSITINTDLEVDILTPNTTQMKTVSLGKFKLMSVRQNKATMVHFNSMSNVHSIIVTVKIKFLHNIKIIRKKHIAKIVVKIITDINS